MCLVKRLPLETNTPSIGYKMFAKDKVTGTLHFIINGKQCDQERMLTAEGGLVKFEQEDKEYIAGFHFLSSPKYIFNVLLANVGRRKALEGLASRHSGLERGTFDIVVHRVAVANVFDKGMFWSDIEGGEECYVCKHILVMEEVKVEEKELELAN